MHSFVRVATSARAVGSAADAEPARAKTPRPAMSDGDQQLAGAHEGLLARDDEREDEAEQSEGLGERDAEEHRGAHHAGRLGLAGHGRDGVADDEADADAGADGRAAVDDATADRGEALAAARPGPVAART